MQAFIETPLGAGTRFQKCRLPQRPSTRNRALHFDEDADQGGDDFVNVRRVDRLQRNWRSRRYVSACADQNCKTVLIWKQGRNADLERRGDIVRASFQA